LIIRKLKCAREFWSSVYIISRLKDARLIVVEGTLYPLLTRLKNAGLLSYRWVESNAGPPRKYYSLTPVGEKFLDELRNTWNELVTAVSQTTHKPASKGSADGGQSESQVSNLNS
jgi:PadR family transcriptional regulator, regulatory protein PadR